MIELTCLASGGGRTILNLLDEIESGRLDAAISTVLVSRAGAQAVQRCRDRGLDVEVPESDVETDTWILSRLEAIKPELACLCGYVRLLPFQPWMRHGVINIHPALLPDFGGQGMHGRHVHEAVLAAGHDHSGCTVHYVDEHYDHGPIILQRTCPVLPDDDPDSLAARVFEQECIAFPEAISLLGQGKVRILNEQVVIET